MISGYNTDKVGIKNLQRIIAQTITIQGILVFRVGPKYVEEFYNTLEPQVASGQIKHQEEITQGLNKVGEVIEAVQRGHNKAKAVVHVADP